MATRRLKTTPDMNIIKLFSRDSKDIIVCTYCSIIIHTERLRSRVIIVFTKHSSSGTLR